jgi:hypothetical protein
VDPAAAREGGEVRLLIEAKNLAAARVGWGVAGAAGTVGAVLAGAGAGLATLFADFGATGQGVLALAVIAPSILAAAGFLRVRRTAAEIASKVDEAAVIVTTELARADGAPLDAETLSRRLHVSTARAEELAARAQVEGMLAPGAPPPRLRVDAGAAEPEAPVPGEAAVPRRHHER